MYAPQHIINEILDYLGYIAGDDGLQVNPEEVKIIT